MICSWPAGRSMSSPASSCWWWEGWKREARKGRQAETRRRGDPHRHVARLASCPNSSSPSNRARPRRPSRVKMDQVLASELAARTFGQVATSQLEDVCGVAAAAEPVATAYARHFRVTGRTCSLLMLESEQDYARFNIKPEEDSFVVKDRPAGPIVAKAVAETTAAMSDPKANFLAWYPPGPRVVGGPLRSAGLAGRRLGGPAGRDVRGGGAAAAMQAAAPQGLAREPAAAVAVGPAGLRNAGRRGPAALDGLRGRRRLAGPQFAGRGPAGRRGPGPGPGLLGHRVAAAGRGLSPLAAGRRGPDLRADHLPRHGPLPGADGPGRPGDRLL